MCECIYFFGSGLKPCLTKDVTPSLRGLLTKRSASCNPAAMAPCTRQLGEMPQIVWQPVPTAIKGFDAAAKRQVAVTVMEEERPKKAQCVCEGQRVRDPRVFVHLRMTRRRWQKLGTS